MLDHYQNPYQYKIYVLKNLNITSNLDLKTWFDQSQSIPASYFVKIGAWGGRSWRKINNTTLASEDAILIVNSQSWKELTNKKNKDYNCI
jgi:hypothetical protein